VKWTAKVTEKMDKLEIRTQDFKLSQASRQEIETLIQKYPSKRSAILPALHIVQAQFGFVPAGPMAELAEMLGILQGEVEQVVTFYRMYNQLPVGKFHVKICDSISCYLRGSDQLIEHGLQKLGTKINETTADGQITVSKVECLAACGAGPCLQVNDEFLYNVQPEQLDEILDNLKTAKENPYFIP
jgi:NADH-quinone oxidoreductase subunit E